MNDISNYSFVGNVFTVTKKKLLFLIFLGTFGLFLVGCGQESTDETQDSESTNGTELTSFAQCLTDNNVVMYGTNTCQFCIRQKEMFGDAFEQVSFVNCQTNGTACTIKDVQSVPLWIVNDQERYSGIQSLEQLSSVSGCDLPTSDA